MPNVLFVYSANLQQSPTAEDLIQNWNGMWQTKSAGTKTLSGRRSLTQQLVDWADLIIAMELHYAQHIQAYYKTKPSKISVLGIPDEYVRNDPQLVRELKRKVTPILKTWKPDSMSSKRRANLFPTGESY